MEDFFKKNLVGLERLLTGVECQGRKAGNRVLCSVTIEIWGERLQIAKGGYGYTDISQRLNALQGQRSVFLN